MKDYKELAEKIYEDLNDKWDIGLMPDEEISAIADIKQVIDNHFKPSPDLEAEARKYVTKVAYPKNPFEQAIEDDIVKKYAQFGQQVIHVAELKLIESFSDYLPCDVYTQAVIMSQKKLKQNDND